MKLLYELTKNFRIIFRNLASLFLLVLGPLTLILLIGFAYSGENIHSINIGITSNDYETLEPAIANFSNFASIINYEDISDCLNELVSQKTHICLEFSSNFNVNQDFPSGTIVFYYDNSRKALSQKLADELSKFFGLQAEKISIDTAQGIFENIQNMVVYLHARSQDIDTLVMESSNIRVNLLDRRQRLIELREEFIPIHDKMITIQARLNSTDENFNDAYSSYRNSSETLISELEKLESSLTIMQINESSISNLSDVWKNESLINGTLRINDATNFTLPPTPLIGLVRMTRMKVQNLTDISEGFHQDIKAQKQEFDTAVLLVSNIRLMIDSDIETSYQYAEKLRIGNEKMLIAQKELNTSISELEKLDPNQAEKLVKPILESFEPIMPGLKNIKIAFPGMLAIIIIFISILFSNILTLSEINSKAFGRNVLAPVKKTLFMYGLIFTNLIVVSFQVLVLIAVAYLSLKIDIGHMLHLVVLVAAMLILIFTFFGMIIASLLRSEQSSILTTTFAALSFFLFSDAIAPLETMPKSAYLIASYNPFVVGSAAFRKLIIFNQGSIGQEVAILSVYLFITFTVLYALSKRF